MSAPELTFIPKNIRRGLLLVLALSAIASSAICIYFSVFAPRLEIAVIALGAAQAAVSGFVVVSLVSFSLRMRTANDLQKLQDDLFLVDILPTLQLCGAPREGRHEFDNTGWFSRRIPKLQPASKLSTNFHRGSDSVSLLLEDPSGMRLDMYIKINVKHIMVRYFFDPGEFNENGEETEFQEVFEQTLNGAKSVGFDAKVLRRFHATKNQQVLELSLYLEIGDGLLADSEKRLFLRNDIRTLTESIMHSLKGHNMLKNQAV